MQITRDAEKSRLYFAVVVRMLVILSLVLAFAVLRAVVVFLIHFVGLEFAVQYYLGYLVAETLPLIPVLWLVVIAHYNHFRETEAQKVKQTHRSDSTTFPLLNDEIGTDDDAPSSGFNYNY